MRHTSDSSPGEQDAVLHWLEQDHGLTFLTGRAGTGKSTLLRRFAETTAKEHVLLAPTGIAAIHIGGSTIHSFFKLPSRFIGPEDEKIKRFGSQTQTARIIRQMETLLIDEVSMVRADLLDAIDRSLRLNTGSEAPFGGKQVVLVGDMLQLPPVVTQNERPLVQRFYDSPYFFSSRVMQEIHWTGMELSTIHRQSDPDFIALLDAFRTGELGPEHLERINERYLSEEQKSAAPREEGFRVNLCPTNSLASVINQTELSALSAYPRTYPATVQGEFPEKIFPTLGELTLKPGAQVIFIRNDPYRRWVNGSMGRVVETEPKRVHVQTENGLVHEVEPVSWDHLRYEFNHQSESIRQKKLGSFTQFPLKLAWAITIHKSQGLTFERIRLHLGKGIFAPGQLYVALSRCRSLEGIELSRSIDWKDLRTDPQVTEFLERVHSRSLRKWK
jgi:ATP-dependent exoDNAse (exonuclease V) alpha subunit